MTVRILHGDCRDVLRTLPDRSVQCCVTSPPYFGLRDYNVDGQIGLEPTPVAFVAEMVAVFREVRRVLRDDGVCWLNLGDSYNGGGLGGGAAKGASLVGASNRDRQGLDRKTIKITGLKPKDLIGIPWRVAFALQDDGWYLRRDVIWAKPNPMPESCTDRPTTAHEYLFLLTKSGDKLFWTHRNGAGSRKQPDPDYRWVHRDTKEERLTAPDGWPEVGKKIWSRVNLWSGSDYFYDAEAVREPMAAASIVRLAQDVEGQAGSLRANGGAKTNGPMKAVSRDRGRPNGAATFESFGHNTSCGTSENGSRNLRSVWTIATAPFAEAHFATFPPKLAETCILAGTSERGACPACGAPWARSVVRTAMVIDRSERTHTLGRTRALRTMIEPPTCTTTGWQPTCSCPASDPVPCVILDPFAGAGTTGLVADRLQRDAVLIELNPDYVEIIRRRVTKDAGLFAEVSQ